MKKIILVIFAAFMFVGCETKPKNNTKGIQQYLSAISIKDIENKNDHHDEFFVYVARPTCSDCEILDDRIIHDLKSNPDLKKLKYLDVTKIHKNNSKWIRFKKSHNIEGTPSFLHYKNGKIVGEYGWTENDGFDYEYFLNWIKNEGI